MAADQWFAAARTGSYETLMNLMQTDPQLIEATDRYGAHTALHYAAAHGQDKIVAQLLAICPPLFYAKVTAARWTALHFAARGGHDAIVVRLLEATDPKLLNGMVNSPSMLPLAATSGNEKVVERLLATSHDLIDRQGCDALHAAAGDGHQTIVELLLSRKPSLIEPDFEGCTPLHTAAKHGHAHLVELLLERKPEHIYSVDKKHRTILHFAVEGFRSNPQLVERLWRMNPEAVRAEDSTLQTPWGNALYMRNHLAADVLRWGLSIDELDHISKGYCQKHLLPVITQLCEDLLEALNQDVMTLVSEYLGFESVAKRANV